MNWKDFLFGPPKIEWILAGVLLGTVVILFLIGINR
jgi:hypothetical protein